MIYPMNNTMTKRLAALAWVMLLANVFLPTGVAFAEEGAPIVSEQVKSQETEKASNEQWENLDNQESQVKVLDQIAEELPNQEIPAELIVKWGMNVEESSTSSTLVKYFTIGSDNEVPLLMKDERTVDYEATKANSEDVTNYFLSEVSKVVDFWWEKVIFNKWGYPLFEKKDSIYREALKAIKSGSPSLEYDLDASLKGEWTNVSGPFARYAEVKNGGKIAWYFLIADDYVYAPVYKTETFYTSNGNAFEVIVDDNGDVNLAKNKEVVDKKYPGNQDLIDAVKWIQKAEILEIDGKKVLFVQMQGGETKAFVNEANSNLKDAFKTQWAQDMTPLLVPDLTQAVKASWVDTTKVVKKYNEIKSGTTTIGYTFHNEANDWFFAPATKKEVKSFYTSNDVEFKVVMKSPTTVDIDATKVLFASVIPTLSAELQALANNATENQVEIRTVEGVDVLFVDLWTSTKAFFAQQNSMFKDAFKGWSDINASVQYENPEKASWVDTSKAVKKYNEVKKDGVVIGYTLKNEANEWFYAKKRQYTPAHRGGGWGGSSSSVSSSSVTTWTTSSVNTWANQPVKPKVEVRNYSWDALPSLCSAEGSSFSEEQNHAYLWACGKDITTIRAISGARLDQPLTRAELAKMMSVYVTKVLGKQPVLTGVAQYPDVDSKMGDLADYIQLAYQLQIMGIHHDGTALSHFEPNKFVTRAEFATVFSRVLYGAKYNQDGKDWANGHLNALKEAGILKNITPNMLELRGRVLLMLQRSTVAK